MNQDKLKKEILEERERIVIARGWIGKGELTVAQKNNGEPSKRDYADDYAYIWFAEDSIPDKRGMVEVEIFLTQTTAQWAKKCEKLAIQKKLENKE